MIKFYIALGKFVSGAETSSNSGSSSSGFSWGVFVSACITLTVFYLNQVFDGLKKEETKDQKELDELKYFNHLVRESAGYIGQAAESLGKGIEKFNDSNKSTFPLLTSAPSIALDRLVTKLDQEKVYLAYLSQIGSNEHISDVLSDFDFAHTQKDQLMGIIEKSVMNSHEREVKLLELLTKLREGLSNAQGVFLNKISAAGEEAWRDPNTTVVARIGIILRDFASKATQDNLRGKPANIGDYYNIFFEPLLSVYHDYKHITEIEDLKPEIDLFRQAYTSLVENNKESIKEVNEVVEAFKTTLTSINSHMSTLNHFLQEKAISKKITIWGRFRRHLFPWFYTKKNK